MPYSLRFVLILLGCGVVGALASGVVQHHQTIGRTRAAAEVMTGGNADAGEAALAHYGCGGCHRAKGVPGMDGRVGPALDGVARRAVIAGQFPNDPGHMLQWVRAPQHLAPGSAMPDQSMPEQDARDIAAWLYTLRK